MHTYNGPRDCNVYARGNTRTPDKSHFFRQTEGLWRLKPADLRYSYRRRTLRSIPTGYLPVERVGEVERNPDRWSVLAIRRPRTHWQVGLAINGSRVSRKIEETIGSFISEQETSQPGHISSRGKDSRFMDRGYCGVRSLEKSACACMHEQEY